MTLVLSVGTSLLALLAALLAIAILSSLMVCEVYKSDIFYGFLICGYV